MSRAPKALIFDLDGTLIDSAPDIMRSTNMKLAEDDYEPYPLAEVRMMIGGGVGKLIERAYAGRGVLLDREARNKLTDRMIEIYGENACVDTSPYPGTEELIRECGERHIPFGLCTNKPYTITCSILKSLGWYDKFATIVGGDSTPAKKPDAAPIELALSSLNVNADDCVIIGDSKADLGAARAVGARVMLVNYGYSKTPVSTLEPDWVIAHLDEVLPTLFGEGE